MLVRFEQVERRNEDGAALLVAIAVAISNLRYYGSCMDGEVNDSSIQSGLVTDMPRSLV